MPGDLDAVRRTLRGLVLLGQRRLHMKDESESRKRSIAKAIAVSGTRATIYDAGRRYSTEWDRRSACLRALVADAAQRGDAMLILEQDDTLITADRKLLYRAARDEDCPNLRYEHRKAAAEQLLALPDAIAWCLGQGRRLETTQDSVRRRRRPGNGRFRSVLARGDSRRSGLHCRRTGTRLGPGPPAHRPAWPGVGGGRGWP